MSQINWLTPSGLLAKIVEEEYFEFQLDAYDTQGIQLTFTVISGNLTDGLQLSKYGEIQGVASVVRATPGQLEYLQTFTVRASNNRGSISDRTFSIITHGISQPQIIPKDISLGTWYDGTFYDNQLVATNHNSASSNKWSVISGELPPGLQLTSAGRLFGYLGSTEDDEYASGPINWDNPRWDSSLWDAPTALPNSKIYRFVVQVFDGARYDKSTYQLKIQSKGNLSIDNDGLTIDNDSITVDVTSTHDPYLITSSQTLPIQRQLSNFAFRVEGVDLDGEVLHYGIIQFSSVLFDQGSPYSVSAFDSAKFDQGEQSIPAGVSIDELSGWITGFLGAQAEEVKTYRFQVFCWTEDELEVVTKISTPIELELVILGQKENVVDWLTPSDLGTITNGSISELSISAESRLGKTLNYRLKEGDPNPAGVASNLQVITYSNPTKNRLPQGLSLLSNGLIVGRPTFAYFSLDSKGTTFDKKLTEFDTTYTFTITASDDTTPGVISNATVSADKTFTVKVKNYNSAPYENLFLKALPTRSQRNTFLSVINDTDIFPDELIYRSGDPWFGKATTIKFLFAAGLTPSMVLSYIDEMSNYHYNKRINLGNVKTAIATDENFNVKYEIVYVEVNDSLTEDGKSITSVINRTNEVQSPYNVSPYVTIYPNSLDNMKTEVETIGYNNKGALPQWMINPQKDGRVLGFTRAIILAYTVPGASSLIAYRLAQSKIRFDDIDFVADRYQLDHALTKYYDIDEKKYLESSETTFDRLPPNTELNPYAGTVDFALIVPFDEINSRTVQYIRLAGGLDGSQAIKDGQLVVFAKQESYNTNAVEVVKDMFDANNFDSIGFNLSISPKQYTSPNDGWNDDQNSEYGELPYDSESYGSSTVVPGFLEKLLSGGENKRGGIWRIEVAEAEIYDNSVVKLVFVKEVEVNQHVLVGSGGQTYSETKIYYDPIVKPGLTVPSYTVLSYEVRDSSQATRFDGGGTRFSNNRDMYLPPESLDAYLKFPKTNVYY